MKFVLSYHNIQRYITVHQHHFSNMLEKQPTDIVFHSTMVIANGS